MKRSGWIVLIVALAVVPDVSAQRNAPMNAENPLIDASAFYMFRSYEPGREGFVTLIANYNPLQATSAAGPVLYSLDTRARYDFHIDNDGDALEDITFRFRFSVEQNGLTVPVPIDFPVFETPIGIANVFPAGPGSPPPPDPGGSLPYDQRVNWSRTYTVRVLRGQVETPDSSDEVTRSGSGTTSFRQPFDNLGSRSIPDYESHAANHVFDIDIPGCGSGRVFVGQRQESYAFNRGKYFDLVGITDLTGDRRADPNPLADHNVTSLALEVPIDCLTEGGDDVIGGWTSARLPRRRAFDSDPTFQRPDREYGDLVQVFRLGNPFVNSAMIGLRDKNLYNVSHPMNDLTTFGPYFQYPSIPSLIELISLFDPQMTPLDAPNNLPRADLVVFYLQGLPGLNLNQSNGEMLRLNTSIPPVPASQQRNLGALVGEDAGYPNGRRPGDDVIDVILRVLEGRLCHPPFGFGLCDPSDAPDGKELITDQVWVDATEFQEAFPYLNTPLPGSGN